MQRSIAPRGPFSATVSSPTALLAVMNFSASFTDGPCALEFSPDGMRLQGVDAAPSAFLDAIFDAKGSDAVFRSFQLEGEYLALHVDPKLLAKVLKAAAAGPGSGVLVSSLTLSVGPRQDRLAMSISSLSKHGISQRSRYEIALLTLAGEHAQVNVEPDMFDFSAQLLCSQPAILADVLSQLKAAGCQEVGLTVAVDAVTFRSRGNADQPIACDITLQEHNEAGKLRLVAEAPCSAAFAFKYFERMSALCKVSTQVVLQLGDEAPLSLVCQLAGGGYCRMYLAPVIDTSDSDM